MVVLAPPAALSVSSAALLPLRCGSARFVASLKRPAAMLDSYEFATDFALNTVLLTTP